MTEGAHKRLRVLLSAFAIAPNQGSEEGMGWNTATRLANVHDVTVLCGDLCSGRMTESKVQEYFRTHGPIPGLEICYVPPSALTRAINSMHAKPGLWFLYYAAYKIWQRDAYAKAQKLHADRPFDLTHQLTFGSYREPGYLWRLPVPFFWGPIAGATSPPMKMLGIGGPRLLVRNFGNAFQRRFSHRSAMAAKKASLTWTVTDDDERLIARWGGRTEQQCEVGTSQVSGAPRVRMESEALRLVWSGLHIARKALPLALETIASLPDSQQYRLDILGSGPVTLECQIQSRRLHIEHLVTWHGRLSQSDAIAVMSKAHALLHTSISESTSAVVLEALALGMPVICHDACGMHTAISDECGIKVPLYDRRTSIKGFCSALQKLVDPLVYNKLSIGALKRASELTWDKKVARISEAYRSACK